MRTFFNFSTKGKLLPFLVVAALLAGSLGLIYFSRIRKKLTDQNNRKIIQDLIEPDTAPFLTEEKIKLILKEALVKVGRFGSEPVFELVSSKRVSWPDGSLGCPEPGMVYTQQVVLGYRAVALVGGEQVEIHIDALKEVGIVCQE